MSQTYVFSHRLNANLGYLVPTSLDSNGRILAVCCSDKFARVIDITTSNPILEISSSNFLYPLYTAMVTPNGKILVTSHEYIRFWDIESGTKIKEFKIKHSRYSIDLLGVSSNSVFVVGEGSGYDTVMIGWDTVRKKKIFDSGFITALKKLVILPNSTKLIVRDLTTKCLQIIDFINLEKFHVFSESYAARTISIDNNARLLLLVVMLQLGFGM